MNRRTLNGYVLVYKPDHPKAMMSENWKGYVYEHILVAEEDLGRSIEKGEIVHHLDMDRSNNNPVNLIVISYKSHKKIHEWIEKGCPIKKNITGNISKNVLRCYICGKPLKLKQKKYCSNKCFLKKKKKNGKLFNCNSNEILKKLKKYSFKKIAKEYGVSDNGLRKWLINECGYSREYLKYIVQYKKMNK